MKRRFGFTAAAMLLLAALVAPAAPAAPAATASPAAPGAKEGSDFGSQAGVFSYVEGTVELARGGSGRLPVRIGQGVFTGDTVYTSADGVAEISYSSGSSIRMEAGSVFSVGAAALQESGGEEAERRSFLRVLLGAISFKFRNITREPEVATPLTVCSVRGTDFTVYTAVDGASLTVVSDGVVEVSAGETSRLLNAGTAVKAGAVLGLGEPFEVKKGFVRYDEFVRENLAELNKAPVRTLAALTETLDGYIREGIFYLDAYNENMEAVRAARQKVQNARSSKGDEAAQSLIETELDPLLSRGLDLNATYRHNFISALMMRYYTFSSLYVIMRTRFLNNPQDARWQEFAGRYAVFRGLYENSLLPLLEDDDLWINF